MDAIIDYTPKEYEMKNQKGSYAFDYDHHRWLHLNPNTAKEAYQLYLGRDLVAQTWHKMEL